MDTKDVHVIINYGDEILISSNETLSLGDIEVESIVIKESNAIVRYIGIG